MTRFVDRPFDWVAILALASGAAVMVPSLVALGMTLVAVITSPRLREAARRPQWEILRSRFTAIASSR